MKPLFISCYTDDHIYRPSANRLRDSLERFGLEYEIKPYAPLGDWVANTCYKPGFIRDMLIQSGDRAVVWLDADAEIISAPVLFDNIDCDIAVGYDTHKNEYLSGTIYLANNMESNVLVNSWAKMLDLSRDDSPRKEQRVMGVVLELMVRDWRLGCQILPEEYVSMINRPRQYPAVILHHQLSRIGKVFYGEL